jgi:hypothetical protein
MEEGMSAGAARERKREQCWVINNEVVDPPPAAGRSLPHAITTSSTIWRPEGCWSGPGRFSTITATVSAPA